ncbi:hypothetical protein [Mucilaginibacter ginsenosidivorans]|uniref:Glycosyltransferase RgtA/B/C/D-like domain-containing protein n=1 Tax=Mucilaginibacter ginsenosidivorans TaxID=398053 RepID=A0A5B8UUH4_9SPHI|nr:hypothetical protein [Mucilaginibacter ginsenosidivorans]QEC62767.1 hypothetical protein FRZ54_09280 [Mucilaginibacter ginsenosidivorans]
MHRRTLYLIILSLLLAGYYIFIGVYLHNLGYHNLEALFYSEKNKILIEGLGNRLKVMGLTAPILPFYGTFIFSFKSFLLGPIFASAVGTALLFYIMAHTLTKRSHDDFYMLILLVLFTLHPGLLYTACSGKSIYLVLIFLFLFFYHILRYYKSNTTFHVSIASICLVVLVFCDYKFIWLTLFFIPLVLFIATQSLNLSEQETIFRLVQSFNAPALRRKLINKTFAIYIIIFLLPLASIAIFKMLNLTHANDLDYFLDSPYATWTVLTEKLQFEQATSFVHYQSSQISPLVTASIALYCPMIVVAIYLFRHNTYQILTVAAPFAFVEFLQIKYDKIFLAHEYFLIFLVLSLLCIVFRGHRHENQRVMKTLLTVIVLIQLVTGYFFLKNSFIFEERDFVNTLFHATPDDGQAENKEMASFINSLPLEQQVMIDDAVAYPVVAFSDHIQRFTMPYQETYLSASEAPEKYVNYILIATDRNPLTGYTQLNNKYLPAIKKSDSNLNVQKVYETDNWILYKVL